MTGTIPEPALLDTSSLSLVVMLFLGLVGLMRGVRAEGVTLAGILAAAVVFGTEALRQRLVTFINKLPRVVELLLAPDGAVVPLGSSPGGGLIYGADERLVFYLGLFLLATALFYIAGSVFGGAAGSRMERLAGFVLGGISGYAVALTLMNFGQEYLSRHPEVAALSIKMPALFAPTLPTTNLLLGYAPLVFLGGLFLMVALLIAAALKH